MNSEMALDNVKEYYGRILQSSADLQTSACCSNERLPDHLAKILPELHEEVKARFYGCGSPFPPALEGRTVLDLGCGAGRDVYLLSKLVGPSGKVIGIDMTDEQLAVAERHVDFHTKKFGYKRPNVRFVKGYIEDLASAGIEDESIDLVVSNCVANLSPDKPRLFAGIIRALKPGGELYFSDVFADRRIPDSLTTDPVLVGECLAGAMYAEDFRRLMISLGILDFRVTGNTTIAFNNAEIERKIGMVGFSSRTIRAFKLDLEDRCEDYGQVAYYKGTIPLNPHRFMLDDHHLFQARKPMLVCGNTADMISKTVYGKHFDLRGKKDIHLGLFDCGPSASASADQDGKPGACC